MTHDRETMLTKILVPLALHYPQAGYTPAQLTVLADDWCEDLAGYSMPVLQEALKKARRCERFFPSVAVMIEYGNAALAARKDSSPALPELPSPERMRRDAMFAAILAASLQGNEKAKAFFASADPDERADLARQVLREAERNDSGARRIFQ